MGRVRSPSFQQIGCYIICRPLQMGSYIICSLTSDNQSRWGWQPIHYYCIWFLGAAGWLGERYATSLSCCPWLRYPSLANITWITQENKAVLLEKVFAGVKNTFLMNLTHTFSTDHIFDAFVKKCNHLHVILLNAKAKTNPMTKKQQLSGYLL